MTLRQTFSIAAAATGFVLSPMASMAQDWNDTYGPVPVTSTGIVAAARFAATARSVEVKKILTAKQAATAHVHYAICMQVADRDSTYLVDTRISKKAGGAYSLDAWTRVKACK